MIIFQESLSKLTMVTLWILMESRLNAYILLVTLEVISSTIVKVKKNPRVNIKSPSQLRDISTSLISTDAYSLEIQFL